MSHQDHTCRFRKVSLRGSATIFIFTQWSTVVVQRGDAVSVRLMSTFVLRIVFSLMTLAQIRVFVCVAAGLLS